MSPLSNATTLANYASGIGTQGATLEIQTANKRVGIGTTNPQGPAGSLQVGTAVTISGNSGIVSATTFHGDFGSSTSVAGNLSVSGVLTYEDVTNIDSVGIITARKNIVLPDSSDASDGRIKFGASSDMMLYHYGGANYIDVTNTLNIRGGGGSAINIKPKNDEEGIKIIPNGAIELYYDNSKKFETTSGGVNVTGTGTFTGSVESSNGNGRAFLGASSESGIAVLNSGNSTVTSLNYDGSASFAGRVQCTGGTTSTTALHISGNNNSAKGIEVYNAGGSLNASIKLDGSATFAGPVYSGGYTNGSQTEALAAQISTSHTVGLLIGSTSSSLNANTAIQVKSSSGTEVVDIKANGSATFAESVRSNQGYTVYPPSDSNYAFATRNAADNTWSAFITAGGSATFAGRVNAGTSAAPVANNFAISAVNNASGGTAAIFAANFATGGRLLDLRAGNVAKVLVENNGNATFASTIQSGGDPNSGTARGTSINEYGTIRAAQTSGTSTVFEGYTVGTSSATSLIKGDGSAEFASQVSTSDRFDSNRTTGTDNVFNGRLNNSVTSKILADGSATFGSFNNLSNTTYGVTIDQTYDSHSGVRAQCKSNATSVGEFFAGYRGTSAVFQVTTGGAASFTGNVTSKATFLNELQSGYSATGSAYKVFAGSSTFVDILNNGSATFAGPVTVNRTLAAHGCFYAQLNGSSNAYIQADGIAQFKDTVNIKANSSNLCNLYFENSGARIQYTTSSGNVEIVTNSAVRNRYLYNGSGTQFVNQNIVYPVPDNAVLLGNGSYRWSAVWAANGTIQTSDSRLKHEVENSVLGTDFIKALRPVSYKWIEGGKSPVVESKDENGDDVYAVDEKGDWTYESNSGARQHWGFIAQEVKQAVDSAGVDFGGWVLADKDDADSTQSLRYDQFIAPLTKALQEAIAEIEILKSEVAALKAG